jgi:GNAT superfamily N-acetyltransferase
VSLTVEAQNMGQKRATIMTDMLVQLLKVPPAQPLIDELRAQHIIIRRANSWELSRAREFAQQWAITWADEVEVGFSRQPVSVFIAIVDGEIAGFCAYECTRRNYLGPMGVGETLRGKNVGKALLLASLHAMREMGYAYAIIGGAGPTEFYQKTCGATVIEGSDRGVYTDMLKKRGA